MSTRIRLQRQGKKGRAFYHVVIADGRAPRDGRFIEKLGTYNPMTNPAEITLNFERALYWVNTGAQPSDTARSILKREGVYMMKHLQGGIAKGALTEIQAQAKFEDWKKDKDAKADNAKKELANQKRNDLKKRIAAETSVKETIAGKIAEKQAAAAKAAAKEIEEATAEAEVAETEAEAETAETATVEETSTEVATEEAPAAE